MKWALIKVIPIAAYAQMVASVGHDPPRVLSRYSAIKHTSPKCWPRCATPDGNNMQALKHPFKTQRFESKVKAYSHVAERFESQRVLNITHDINAIPIKDVNVKTSSEMKKADEVSPHAVTKSNNTVSQATDTPITKQPFVRPRNDAAVRLNISRPDKVETHMMLADDGEKISRKKNAPQMKTSVKVKSAILMQNMILSKKNAVIAKHAALYNAINNAANTKAKQRRPYANSLSLSGWRPMNAVSLEGAADGTALALEGAAGGAAFNHEGAAGGAALSHEGAAGGAALNHEPGATNGNALIAPCGDALNNNARTCNTCTGTTRTPRITHNTSTAKHHIAKKNPKQGEKQADEKSNQPKQTESRVDAARK